MNILQNALIYIDLHTYFEDMNIKCICIYDRKRRDEEKACYGKLLGCFYDEGPFDYLDMLPSPPELVSKNKYKYVSNYNHIVF